MKKKGQAAMEFLMTYGWAILVVLIAISALAYFGVLNPSRFLPESCTLVPGLACVDFKVTTTEMALIIQNGMGENLNDVSINMGDCQLKCYGCGNKIEDGKKTTWRNSTCSQNLGIFKKQINISYKKGESPITRTKQGEIKTKVIVGKDLKDTCEEKRGYYTNHSDFGIDAIPYCWFHAEEYASCNTTCIIQNLVCASENNEWNDNENCQIGENLAGEGMPCTWYGWSGSPATWTHLGTINSFFRPPAIGANCNEEGLENWSRICPCVK